MGAMHNDLNRCNFMFSDDRRCRNLIHTPGAPFCYFHANGGQKKPKPAPPDERAARAFFQWLATHPLDNATHVNQAVNQIALLLVGKRISVRRADALLRLLRVAIKSVPDVHEEFTNEYRRRHWPQGDHFLREIDPLIAAAAPAGPPPSADPPQDPGPAAPGLAPSQLPVEISPIAAAQPTPAYASSEPARASSPPQHSTDSAPLVIPASSQASAPTPQEIGSPRPTPAPPAPPPGAPLPSVSGAVQPKRASLPADLSPKEVRSILRALLVAAASASSPPRKPSASSLSERRTSPPQQAPT